MTQVCEIDNGINHTHLFSHFPKMLLKWRQRNKTFSLIKTKKTPQQTVRFQQIFRKKVARGVKIDFTMWRKVQWNVWVGSARRESICSRNLRDLVFGRIQYNKQYIKGKNEAQALLGNLNVLSTTHTTSTYPLLYHRG